MQPLNQQPLVQKILTQPNYQFWALNLFGWAGYGFFVALSAIFWDRHFGMQVAYTLLSVTTGLMLSLGLREFFKKIWNMNALLRGIYSLLAVIVTTGLWSYLKMEVFFYLNQDMKTDRSLYEYLGWYTYSFFIFLSWAALYFSLKYYRMLQAEKEKTLKAQAMAHEAQLKMLRYQLNPHFLFNTLNAISTLILEKETATANGMVTELSKFLRYSLDNNPMQKVTLAQEVETLKLYLGIEKLRFEERLNIHFRISESARNAHIPNLLLQPLIENAIKYAIAKSPNGGTIELDADVLHNQLSIQLTDDGPGIADIPVALRERAEGQHGGVGLANTRERLHELYGAAHSFELENIEPHGLRITIRIPYSSTERSKAA
ncbi:histidine kinase [Simiduia sp. 21SJ11W-1]|uniref:sensor histidine kinase n=1 Tax=Simiduia sp. 21SJ11W-1 TaxID=2909669 RepID=UPI0020A0A584|nr:histidine kinase [Simiduia sp. 21SJ11W-1]UTA48044.1 histidine kinase [Simiduia sp. 21SJ11W-1]